MNDLPKESFVPAFLNFSAQTSANQTQVTQETFFNHGRDGDGRGVGGVDGGGVGGGGRGGGGVGGCGEQLICIYIQTYTHT